MADYYFSGFGYKHYLENPSIVHISIKAPAMLSILAAVATGGEDRVPDPEYRIGGFKSERVFEQPSNRVWEPLESGKASVLPDSAAPGRFILRRKYGAREYALFPGRMAAGAYAELFAFRLDSLDMRQRLAVKLYSRRNEDWYRDLEDVYFLDDLVLAGQPLLYCRPGGEWKEMRALPRKPARLVVRSNPPGAEVWLDGKPAGKAPLDKIGFAESHLTVRMELPGHYAREEPIGLSAASEITVDWTLSRLLPADTVTASQDLPLKEWVKAEAPSLDAYDTRQERIRAEIAVLEKARSQSIARFDSSYPKLKPREEFEKKPEFEAREKAYGSSRDSAQKRLTAKPDSGLRELRWADSCLEEKRKPMEMRLTNLELDEVVPELLRYDADKELLPFRFLISRPPLLFKYSGKLTVGPEAAKRLKAHPDSLRFTARYWNLGIRSEGTLVFPSIDSLGCSLAGKPLRIIDDTLEYPEAWSGIPGYSRARKRAAAFAQERALGVERAREAERARLAEEKRRARLARQAHWRKVRLYSGLAVFAAAAGSGVLALVENSRSDASYAAYLDAQTPQKAVAEREEVRRHDRNALMFAWGGGIGLCIALPLSLF